MYLMNENGQQSSTATLTPLGEVKVTNSNITSLFTETYYNGNYYQGEDINLIGRTLKKFLIEETEGNSPNFEGSNNYLFIEFGPSHFSDFRVYYDSSINERYGNYSLKRVKLKEGFVTDNIDDSFRGLQVVEMIDGLKYIDTSNFTSLKSVFQYCKRLKEADVSMWDVTLVEDMQGLFNGCESLTTVGDLSVWIPYTLRNDKDSIKAALEYLSAKSYYTSNNNVARADFFNVVITSIAEMVSSEKVILQGNVVMY